MWVEKKGWMYILECCDGSYYTGSTNNLEARINQHMMGEGANHTRKRLPVKLVYSEEYRRIDFAFYREKQVQGWSRKKKEALINGEHHLLPKLASTSSANKTTSSANKTTSSANKTTSSANKTTSSANKTTGSANKKIRSANKKTSSEKKSDDDRASQPHNSDAA